MIANPKTFAEAHAMIDARQLMRMRHWLDAQGKGGAYAGSRADVLAAVDRYYDCGTIGWVIDRM